VRLFRLFNNHDESYLFIYLSFEGSVYWDMGNMELEEEGEEQAFILVRTIRKCII
jgi:hypothetical protein